MTHAKRLLELLSDGKPHSHHETYRLGIMAHSRAADLRKQGHDVRVWREGGSYWYQLDAAPTAGGRLEPSPAVGGTSGFQRASEVGPGDDGETHSHPGVPENDLPRSPSPGQEGTSPQGVPSDQLALELPARLRDEAA